MNLTYKLAHPNVRLAIDALQEGDAAKWFDLFTKEAVLFDDGRKVNFVDFFTKALGHERFTSIDKVENEGLTLWGDFHSDQWGDFKTYFRFSIDNTGKFNRLDIGQA